MKNLVILTSICIYTLSCIQTPAISGGFYDKVLQERKVFKDYLKYKGNHQELSLLDKQLIHTKKIITLSTFNGFTSFSTIYDCDNSKYYYLESNKEGIYKHNQISKEEVLTNFLFVLEYILDDKIEELKKISEEAYDLESGMFIYVDILDVQSKTYKRYQFKEFEVYNGKPIMTKEEFYKSNGIYE